MPPLSVEEIRRRFSFASDFNEIFDAFKDAMAQGIQDVELYRLLFWNHSLSTDELKLFGEKLAHEFPDIGYDVYMWLASVFEVTYSAYDNYELAVEYYMKAAAVRPTEPDPYLDAADCYEPDLNIPPINVLIEFLREGTRHVGTLKSIYQRLAYLFEIVGDLEQSQFYRSKADAAGAQPAAE